MAPTHLHPFPGRYGGTRARPRLYFERIHDARRPGEAKSKGATGREMILERALRIEEPRTIVDGFHFHTQAAISAVVEPGHQQMAVAAAIFQNVASEFGRHGCNHRHLGGSERLPQPLVELNVHHGRMQVRLSLNVKSAERRPRRIRARAPVRTLIQFQIGHGWD